MPSDAPEELQLLPMWLGGIRVKCGRNGPISCKLGSQHYRTHPLKSGEGGVELDLVYLCTHDRPNSKGTRAFGLQHTGNPQDLLLARHMSRRGAACASVANELDKVASQSQAAGDGYRDQAGPPSQTSMPHCPSFTASKCAASAMVGRAGNGWGGAASRVGKEGSTMKAFDCRGVDLLQLRPATGACCIQVHPPPARSAGSAHKLFSCAGALSEKSSRAPWKSHRSGTLPVSGRPCPDGGDRHVQSHQALNFPTHTSPPDFSCCRNLTWSTTNYRTAKRTVT